MSALAKSKASVEDYLAGEPLAEIRHEYIAGDIHAMAGASERHNRISLNIAFALRGAARGGRCGVYMSDMKLRTVTKFPASTCFYYPDVMLGCNTEDDHPLYKTSPCLIAEVLSPSTESIDRREKLLAYSAIKHLKYYILVSSMQETIEYHERNNQGEWIKFILGKMDIIHVQYGDYQASLCFDDIYEDVRW